MDIIRVLAAELSIKESQADAAVKLIDEGCTIPFIARYRKEATGSLNDEVLRNLDERLRYLRNLEDKKAQVISSIESQGKLTEDLKAKIENAQTLMAVDDLYMPYRPKKRTRAMIAREKGLEPLADIIYEQKTDIPLEKLALDYVNVSAEHPVKTAEEAIAGAKDILAERIADSAEYRSAIRRFAEEHGVIVSSAKNEAADEKKVYEAYYDYSEPVKKCPGHRVLAMNRGEAEKILSVKLETPDEQIIKVMERSIVRPNPVTEEVLKDTVSDSYRRLILPAIEREIRGMLKEKAETGAIKVFGENLTQLLMQPPITGETVLGWDPAFRTGCKLAVSDPTGKIIYTTVIYPTAPQNKVEESKKVLKDIIRKYKVTLISLGNGTASRESEQVICELIREMAAGPDAVSLKYIIVNEAGASVYSASKLATEEFPNFDVGQRSASSMARRLQDPLAELVKIDPKSLGVGQYQHDMDQKKLEEALHAVVEDCVNRVGVDLNTASASLLGYISGINKTLAGNIIAYREANGSFKTRKELLKVPKLGPKAFEQCAGFLRIRDGAEPLDMTGIHPESYRAAGKLLEKLGYGAEDIRHGGVKGIAAKAGNVRKLADELGVGSITLGDIIRELEKPGRDPRDEMPKPVLRSDVMELSDLKVGMVLKGTVRNVIDFGAFVDIGVHQDGLVHISQMTDRYIKHPLEAVSLGDVVEVQVISLDIPKKRIGLSMRIKR